MKISVGNLRKLIREAVDDAERCPACGEVDGFSGDHCDVCGWPNDEDDDIDVDAENQRLAERVPTGEFPSFDADPVEVARFLNDVHDFMGEMYGGWGLNPTLKDFNDRVADWIDGAVAAGVRRELDPSSKVVFDSLAGTTRFARDGKWSPKPTD